MNCFFVLCHRRLAAIVACCLIGANASAASFDAAVGYSPAFVLAQTAGLPSASYVRFLGFELRLGLWTSLGFWRLPVNMDLRFRPICRICRSRVCHCGATFTGNQILGLKSFGANPALESSNLTKVWV